jgi:hypothetical protein
MLRSSLSVLYHTLLVLESRESGLADVTATGSIITRGITSGSGLRRSPFGSTALSVLILLIPSHSFSLRFFYTTKVQFVLANLDCTMGRVKPHSNGNSAGLELFLVIFVVCVTFGAFCHSSLSNFR